MHGHWLKGYLRDGKEIEGGGGGSGGGIVVDLLQELTVDNATYTSTVTAADLYEMCLAGPVTFRFVDNFDRVLAAAPILYAKAYEFDGEESATFRVSTDTSIISLTASALDGYPSYHTDSPK